MQQPADRLAQSALYLCTDARRERGDLAEFADAALAGGVDLIQLRDKGSAGERQFGPLEARQELDALEVLADAARRHGALLAVNDRADIALAAGADVVKTSTGKGAVGATFESAAVLCAAARAASDASGSPRGFKAAGGVRTPEQALRYQAIVSAILGPEAATDAHRFRIGASSLLDGIVALLGA